MSFRSSGRGPMTLSQVPGGPSFRSSAVNAVAVIPLLSSDRNGQDNLSTHSSRSFNDLFDALHRYSNKNNSNKNDDMVLVVPNGNLTRPGDWKYDQTPLKNFHWGHGCQRMSVFDGRPYNSRMAHDRLINHELTRNWIDLCPHRRTAAVIGVLNARDCPDEATLQTAVQEWKQWAERYSTPPYEVTAHGRDFERDFVVQRIFIFDSFHEDSKIDCSKLNLGSRLVAFPPVDGEHAEMMSLHMNVVINDLAVAIFQELEGRIRESDAVIKGTDGQPSAAAKSRFAWSKSGENGDVESPRGSDNLSINNLATVVSPESKLAASANPQALQRKNSVQGKLENTIKGSSSEAQLLTPLDDIFDYSELSPKDAHFMMRREIGRREKFAGDLALLAGSPLDAYERFTKAAGLCKTSCPDPLWYASALEGCAAAHIAMAEVGGFNVDEYLESSFQLPDEIMACAVIPSGEKSNKQTMSHVVAALSDDALDVLGRHPKLACFKAELLLKLAWYVAEIEDTHVRCQWGLGEGCYGGDPSDDKRRWEMPTSTQFNFLDFKHKSGEDVIARNTLKRCKNWSKYMHEAASCGGLDNVTRADVSLRCASLSLRGIRPTSKPTLRERPEERLPFRRKASFFAVAAAESMSVGDGDAPDERAGALWVHASRMLAKKGNKTAGGNYGWATLRAVTLHGLAMQGPSEASEDAAVQLLSLMSEITPTDLPVQGGLFFSNMESDDVDNTGRSMDDSMRSDGMIAAGESVVSAARSYVRERANKVAQGQRSTFFSGQQVQANLLTVAQSRWVDDEAIPPVLFPMAEFSEISDSVLAMRAVWSAIRYENCFAAQKKLVGEISDLRKNMPASTMSGSAIDKSSSLPIRIKSVVMVNSESVSALERVKTKPKEKDTGAMATFFNPYANKKGDDEATIVPEGEERYIMVNFANTLSIPLEIPRSQLEFSLSDGDRIKAPAISFVIPGQTDNFTVQFPFIILPSDNGVNGKDDASRMFEINGLHLTCLARSFFLPLKKSTDDADGKPSRAEPNLPRSASLYPRRKRDGKEADKTGIESPRLEVVPPQPNLLLSFASSVNPMAEDTIIPAPLADGENFTLPKICLRNGSGINRHANIEELQITAAGLPGKTEIILFDLNGTASNANASAPTSTSINRKPVAPPPFTITATHQGLDSDTLNNQTQTQGSSFISIQLGATPDMGAKMVAGCTLKLKFRYRGRAPSADVEVWRERIVEIRVLRIKGPRISSLTFRPDLSWESSYSNLCQTLLTLHKHNRFHTSRIMEESDLPTTGCTDNEDFVVNRFGMDPGVNVCGDKTTVVLSISNETTSPILVYRPEGNLSGFGLTGMKSMKISPGVSAKMPMDLPRVARAPGIAEQLITLTRLNWKSEIETKEGTNSLETGGTMVPVNQRIRSGTIEIPLGCMKSIIDENPTFLSRICKAPCSISVNVAAEGGTGIVNAEANKPMNVSVEVCLADWIPDSVLKQSKYILEFCCSRIDPGHSSKGKHDYVWCGQIRKSLSTGGNEKKHSHSSRILFLEEGRYAISACVIFRRTDTEDDLQELWWAEKAQQVRVRKTPPAT